MYCSFCGAKLPDNAKFCYNCGAQSGTYDLFRIPAAQPQTKFVPAKCTNCGASLNVDPGQTAAVCPFCNSAYIVEKAIQDYRISVSGNVMINGSNISINGKNIDNLLERANQYARTGDFDEALKFFNEVLDSDINSEAAQKGIQKIKIILNDYVYLRENTNKGLLELKKGRLILNAGISPQLFELEKIYGLSIVKRGLFSSEKSLQFTYSGIPEQRVSINTTMTDKWFILIEDAKMGKYPQMVNLGLLYAQSQ